MPYQDANRRFAGQIGVAAEVFDRPLVALELPPGQEGRPEAVAAFVLAANLLSRLFTRLRLVGPDVEVGCHPWALASLHALEGPLSGISEGSVRWGLDAPPDIVLSIGAPPTVSAAHTTYASFNGWVGGLDRPVAPGPAGIFGGLFAACYGTAQVFLCAASAAGAKLPRMRPFALSLLDYTLDGANAETPRSVDIGVAHLVGVGAVGSALVYGLGHLPELAGTLHLIDNDAVDEGNLQRYALMRRSNIDSPKPDVAAAALAGRSLNAVPHAMSFKDFAGRDGYAIDLLITPIDSEAGRRRLAACLPRSILNAATGQTTVTVSRHGFADGRACLNCLYLPPRNSLTTEQRLAHDLGLSINEVLGLIEANVGVDEPTVRRIERHREVPDGQFQELIGRHVQSLYQRAVCGAASVPTSNGTLTAPLSFISATAGILLAAELVKGSAPALAGHALDNYFRLDTLCAPNPAFRERREPEPSRRCLCWDADYVATYRAKYENG